MTDEPGFVAFGGQAEQVSAALKEHYSPGMSLSGAFAAALAALSASGNGERTEIAATQLEVAILDRTRDHRAFRRIRAARLAELIRESGSAGENDSAADGPRARRPRPRRRRTQGLPRARVRAVPTAAAAWPAGYLAEPALRSEPLGSCPGSRPAAISSPGRPAHSGMLACCALQLGGRGDGPGQLAARPAGLDDRVDDAELDARGSGRRRPARARRPAPSRPRAGCSGGTEASVRRCRMRMAATAPITATSAPGQAKTRVAPSARQFIAM